MQPKITRPKFWRDARDLRRCGGCASSWPSRRLPRLPTIVLGLTKSRPSLEYRPRTAGATRRPRVIVWRKSLPANTAGVKSRIIALPQGEGFVQAACFMNFAGALSASDRTHRLLTVARDHAHVAREHAV